MVLITIVTGAYKPAYNWGASQCGKKPWFPVNKKPGFMGDSPMVSWWFPLPGESGVSAAGWTGASHAGGFGGAAGFFCCGLVSLPSGKLTVCYGKSQFLMGKSTISMAIFNSYVWHNQRVVVFVDESSYLWNYQTGARPPASGQTDWVSGHQAFDP